MNPWLNTPPAKGLDALSMNDPAIAPDPNAQPPNAQPPAGGLDAAAAPGGPKQIAALPPGLDLKFDEKKLPDVKTPADLVDAMKPKSRNTFMDWWEQQHGSIDAVHDKMLTELGQKPDPNRPMSRKEKFQMLMDFGIHLIKASQANESGDNLVGASAVALGNSVIDQQGNRALEGAAYDQRQAGIEGSRQSQQKQLGSFGDALKGQSAIDENQAQMQHYAAEEERAKNDSKPAQIMYGPGESDADAFVLDPKTKRATKITDDAGKSLRFSKMGSRGGLPKDARPAQQKIYEWLKGLKGPSGEDLYSDEVAAAVATHQPTGDPRKDYTKIYSDLLRSTFGDTEAATKGAKAYIDQAYPAGTGDLLKQPTPALDDKKRRRVFDPKSGGFQSP